MINTKQELYLYGTCGTVCVYVCVYIRKRERIIKNVMSLRGHKKNMEELWLGEEGVEIGAKTVLENEILKNCFQKAKSIV